MNASRLMRLISLILLGFLALDDMVQSRYRNWECKFKFPTHCLKHSSHIIQFVRNLVQQTIEEYFKKEILIHLSEVWIDHTKTKVGYEINFTKYFYEFKSLIYLSDIRADILSLEAKVSDEEQNIFN